MAAGLTVGDFSRASHLSVKTLRHYHQVGLLEPAAVNPDPGYRYYTAAQIPTAQVIRRLRDLEMRHCPGPAPARHRAGRRRLRQCAVPGRPRPGHRVHPGRRAGAPIGRVAPQVVPAAELAIISHHGPLADADLSYARLGSDATTHEISIDGPLREYHVRDAQDTPDQAEWRTDIGWPIFRADAPA